MQLGAIKDPMLIGEYVSYLENALTVARELRSDPANSKYVANLNLVIARLERLVSETRQGRIMNEIDGMTKFAGDWPISRARLALAIWEAERFFKDKIIRIVLTEMGRL